VAVGEGASASNSILYSPDGSNWCNSINGGFNSGIRVAYGNDLWVAVGNCANTSAPVSTILYSSDGSNWSNAVSGGFYEVGRSVAYGNNMWVAVGDGSNQQTLQYSGNGSNWSNANGVFNSPTSVTYTRTATLGRNNKIVFSNLWTAYSETRNQYSVDGSNWTYRPNNNVTRVIRA
jgi:hypothetical protein